MTSEWSISKLGDVATLQRGFDLPSRLRRRGVVPIVSSSGVSGWHNRAMVSAPGVVTGRYGTIGEVFFQEVDFWPLNTTLWVSNFHGNDPRYIFYLLQRLDFNTHSGKSGVPGVNRNDLHRELVTLPTSRAEQRQIAVVLTEIDELIESMRRLIAKKRALRQGTSRTLLSGRTRLPGFRGEWVTTRLGEIADPSKKHSFVGGPFGSSLKASEYTASGVRVLQLQNIGDGEFRDDYVIYTSDRKADQLVANNVYPGDILIAKMGDPVARACVVPEGHPRYLMASDGIRLAVDSRRFDTLFVAAAINQQDVRDQAEAVSTGTTRKRISLGALRRLDILVPRDVDEQRAIGQVLADCQDEISNLERRLASTRAIRLGMMQELLTGRTRLKVEARA